MITIANFRDIGGVKNKQGKTVIKKKFFRSGEWTERTKKEIEVLHNDYHLGTIFDFRSEDEVKQNPDQLPSTIHYVHIDILGTTSGQGASIADFFQIGSTEKVTNYMQTLYKKMALDPIAQNGYSQFLKKIAEIPVEKSILFHCFAGKDRTGIGALLLLETLDVSRKKIYQDYLLTNQMRKTANTLILDEAKNKQLAIDNLRALATALNVDSLYLDTYYQAVEEQFGTIATYLEEVIGVDSLMKANFQKKFLLEAETDELNLEK